LQQVRYIVLLCTLAGACAQAHPERACVDPKVHDLLVHTLFEDANRAVDAYAADGTFAQPAAIKAQLASLQLQRPIRFETVAFDGFDKTTSRVTCSATIRYVLPASDRTAEARQEAALIHGLDAPLDLLGDAPKSVLAFASEPSPSGKGSVVSMNGPDAVEPVSGLLLLAVARERRANRGAL